MLRLGMETGDAVAHVVGVELELWTDGAPSVSMGVSMLQTKHMRELGCFSMMLPPCSTSIMASTRVLGEALCSELPGRVLGQIDWSMIQGRLGAFQCSG